MSGEDVLPETVKKLLFSTVDPIYDFHCAFLEELEKRMQLWYVSCSIAGFITGGPYESSLGLVGVRSPTLSLHFVKFKEISTLDCLEK